MKNNISSRLPYFVLMVSLLFIAGCGGSGGDDPQPDPEDPQVTATKLLTANTWKVNSVTRDNTDVGSEFAGFTLSFTNTGYTTVNGATAWDASGTWVWVNSTTTTDITLSNSIQNNNIFLQIAFSSDNSILTTTFTVPETVYGTGGRFSSLEGNYVFVLGK